MSWGTKILSLLRKQPEMTMFLDSERYVIDFDEGLTADGWIQYDTEHDASYYGVWVNPKLREVLTYAEGDWRLKTFDLRETFVEQLEKMAKYYGSPPPAFTAIAADGTVAKYFDRRPTGEES